jgi:hypothetical protein
VIEERAEFCQLERGGETEQQFDIAARMYQ